MPVYICMRVDEIPLDEQMVTGPIYRCNAASEDQALQAFATRLGANGSGVYGVALAANISRRTVQASPPTFTVT